MEDIRAVMDAAGSEQRRHPGLLRRCSPSSCLFAASLSGTNTGADPNGGYAS